MDALAFAITLFTLGALAVAGVIADLPVLFVIAFCLFLVAASVQISYHCYIARQRRKAHAGRTIEAGTFDVDSYMHTAQQRVREAKPARAVETMQIKVEADTSQATAAIDELEQRVQSCTEKVEALNRLAILNVMAEA